MKLILDIMTRRIGRPSNRVLAGEPPFYRGYLAAGGKQRWQKGVKWLENTPRYRCRHFLEILLAFKPYKYPINKVTNFCNQ